MTKGYLSLVLHAHLPFVRHPEHEDFLEEDWLYEAVAETYLPLLESFEKLVSEGVDFKLTMTMSPPLCNMLGDDLLKERIHKRLARLVELGDREIKRLGSDSEFIVPANMYRQRFERLLNLFDSRNKDLLSAFGALQEKGYLEIITCGATHGFLPLLRVNPKAVEAQVRVAVSDYQYWFHRKPRGIWLPECGYYPGLDKVLSDNGLGFFFLDTHGIENARPRPVHGIHRPLLCPTGVAALARDPECGRQVWSADEGYPGDPDYREFYRDIGFDLPLDYIAPYVQPTGERKNTGYKYYRITGKVGRKQVYDPDRAHRKAEEHAGNFMFFREKQVDWLSQKMDVPPLVTAPFDAELFGHWWFEGPLFLEHLLRKIHCHSRIINTSTPVEYLDLFPVHPVAVPSMSTWGAGGYCEVWCEGSNDWIYPHLHRAADRLIAMARKYAGNAQALQERVLNQAARELLLAQSSDWAFIMKTRTMVEYAVRRTREHLSNFHMLADMVEKEGMDETTLAEIESRDNIFPSIDFRMFTG
ncbi:MAG: DUF1957 domain-containing protein [Deltaproteobacteria bacterium]|nr:DUF1957 domain-containing protein [Deltaproteobacteria bacterium]